MTLLIPSNHPAVALDPRREAEINAVLAEVFAQANSDARALARKAGPGFVGFGIVEHRDGGGDLVNATPFTNLITTAGDQYYAQKGIVGISPANAAAPTAISGMKLGTGSTAAAKSGTGAALITYITGSNNPFDSSFPTATAVGSDGGWNITYKTSWLAGDVTNAAIVEVVLVNDAATDATSTAANTIARAVISSVNKAASDALAVTWTHKMLGA